ncbi:hypothetical protein STEG23_022548 [Scotinomys teguina]
MLFGQGQYANIATQINYDPAVYAQIGAAAVQAWTALHNTAAGDQLSKVVQGSSEPFSKFVSCLMQLAGKIFGDVDTAMPVIKQLVFENANKYCKEALRAHKDKILNDMIRLCRDIDGNHITGQFWQLPFDRDLVEIQGLDQSVVLDVARQDILVRTVPMANNRPGRKPHASVQNAKRGSIGVMSVAPNMMLKGTPYSRGMNRGARYGAPTKPKCMEP